MRELNDQERRQVLLDTLVEFDKNCDEIGVHYSVAEGTLIGVARHKGFIPWDDDIDIYMLRGDYERFIREYRNEGLRFQVIALENSDIWNRPYAKYYDSNTLEQENTRFNVGIGLGIDIFPLDSVPEDIKIFHKYRKKLYRLRDYYVAKSLSLSLKRSFAKNISIVLMQIALAPFSQRYLAKRVSSYSQKFNNAGSSLLCDNVEGYKYREPYSISEFASYIRMPFENITVSVMEQYHVVLTKEYGDYMKLPPVDQRITHHGTKTFRRD